MSNCQFRSKTPILLRFTFSYFSCMFIGNARLVTKVAFEICFIEKVIKSKIHTPTWFIHWLCQSVILWFKYLENTFIPKPYKLQTWSFDIIITSLRLSHFMCYLSHIKCHMSHVTRPISTFFFFSFFYKVVKIVGWGSVINWAYPV